jgi:polyvinyl alcohol dehydrogenase (cytochrome)
VPRRLPQFLALVLLLTTLATPAVAGSADWPAYLFGPKHPSSSSSAAITPANVGTLAKAWTFTSPRPTLSGQPSKGFVASPIVSGGKVFIGSNTGVFYALNETTGTIAWSRFLGFVKKTTCNARGIASTATVAADPASGKPTVYVSSGDGYLFALDAATGSIVWRSVIALPSPTQNDYFDWSSPSVANGSVYIGVSSQCDAPLVRAGVKRYDQATGALESEYFTVPEGQIGASVWSSVAVTSAAVFVTTGNTSVGVAGDGYSIVKLDPATLVRTGKFTIPGADRVGDSDFGGSPSVFPSGGAQAVGACNKGGYFYVVRTSDMTLRWKLKLAQGSPGGSTACLASGVFDGTHLYLAGPLTTIDGVDYRGSVREVDPATGEPAWETGLPGVVIGTPALNAAAVIAAPIFESDASLSGTYLLNAGDGSILRFLAGGSQFAQPTFAGKFLFTASQNGAVVAWKVP